MSELHLVRRKAREVSRLGWCALLVVLVVLTACQTNTEPVQSTRFSGAIEGTKVDVMTEVGGRITRLAVGEGDAVTAGQPLVILDDASFVAQVKQAEAAVAAATANLAQVKAGTRAEAIQAAEAALQQMQAEQLGAALTLSNTLKIRNNPQQLIAQIDAAQSGVKLAEQSISVAQTQLDEARYWRDFYRADENKIETLDKEIAIAQKNLEAAQAQWNGAKAQLAVLQAMRAHPISLQAQVDQARSAYSLTLASTAVAAANLDELKAGPSAEELALAAAKVQQAEAQLKLAQAYQSRTIVKSPLTGIVAEQAAHVGESAQPGTPLMSLINVDTLDMTIFVPQAELPRVQIGMPAKVYVDAYPNDVFNGEVVSIAQEAQFSSRDTQNQEDRTNVVFAVKVRLPNADKRLKAGMTADAELVWQ